METASPYARLVQTKVDQELEDAEARFEDDPVRAGMVRAARRFKASWVELGEALTETRRNGAWKKWGFTSFEEYAKKELHLRAETVDKLTGSFSFLKARAPEVLSRDALTQQIPTYQAVDYLRKAQERPEASEKPDVFSALYTKVVDEGMPLAKAKNEFGPTLFPRSVGEQKSKDETALRGMANRLLDLVRGSKVLRGDTRRELEHALDAALAELPAPVTAKAQKTPDEDAA